MSSGGGSTSTSGRQLTAERVERCPACGAENPDPDRGTLCPACGALLASRARAAYRAGLGALAVGAAGIALAILAVIVVQGALGDGPLPAAATIGLFLLGAALAVGGAYALRRVAAETTVRESPPAHKLLNATDSFLVGLLTLFALSSAVLAYFTWVYPATIQPRTEAAFAGQLGPFLELPEGADEADPSAVPPRIAGRMLVLDRQANLAEIPAVRPGQVSTVHFLLPSRLRARRPDEVAAIVLLDWQAERYSSYSSGREAYVVKCDVRVVDAAGRRAIARRTFEGGPPPPQVPRGQDGYGSRPDAQIAEWVAGMADGG